MGAEGSGCDGVSAITVVIRAEMASDMAAIHDLSRRSFAGKSFSDGFELDMIDALRSAGVLTVSLVAEQAGTIIGHIALSPAHAQDGSGGWYTLGPISVDPARQRQGIGGKLIAEGMRRLGAMNATGCVLIGDTNYYPRHGFVRRPDLAPPNEPAAHYMVRALSGRTPDTTVEFHPVFHQSGPAQ